MFPNNLALYLQDLKLLSLAISALKLSHLLNKTIDFLLFQNNLDHVLLDYIKSSAPTTVVNQLL